jgi:tRNA U34 2-thiouridine synthase MnmA/TrmU
LYITKRGTRRTIFYKQKKIKKTKKYMSTKSRPIPGNERGEKITQTRGILYYTIGTHRVDNEGSFYIDETRVKEGFNYDILQSLENEGRIIVLKGNVLTDYISDQFSYIDDDNANSNAVRRLKDAEAAIAELQRKNETLAAQVAETNSKTSKGKGVSNA